MTTFSERCEREDEEDRVELLSRLNSLADLAVPENRAPITDGKTALEALEEAREAWRRAYQQLSLDF